MLKIDIYIVILERSRTKASGQRPYIDSIFKSMFVSI